MIKLKNLSKKYTPDKIVLNDITYDFEHRKITGIVANNGEGKTTLFNCISRLDRDYSGQISYEQSINTKKKPCGYLPTDLYFYPKITGREYVKFCATARDKDYTKIDEWAKVFDLPLDDYISNYSTGMKKKVGLLGLLVQDNELIILDEPFNGLDIATNILLTSILDRLRCQGKTILLSSHILSTLTDISDSILVLKNGKLDASYTRENFSKLVINMKTENQESENLMNKLFESIS